MVNFNINERDVYYYYNYSFGSINRNRLHNRLSKLSENFESIRWRVKSDYLSSDLKSR